MSSWGENEKRIWEASEVLKEFEKQTAERAVKLAAHVASLDKTAAPVQQGLKEIATSAESARKSVSALKKDLGNLSDDQNSNPAEDESAEPEVSEDEKLQNLVSELQVMANDAAAVGNIKLAYKIERTIDELLGR